MSAKSGGTRGYVGFFGTFFVRQETVWEACVIGKGHVVGVHGKK